ncbi:MAG: hypothetical protein AAFZ52_18890, partial [Bacteroidota bacterium]
MIKTVTLFTLLLLGATSIVAQTNEKAALDYLQNKYASLDLEAGDVADLRVMDNYESDGVRHIYVGQWHQGVPIQNAQAILHFRDNQLVAK